MRYCQACGHPNADDSKFCEKCGTTLATPVAATPASPPAGSTPPPPASVAASATQAVGQGAAAAKWALGSLGPVVVIAAAAVVVIAIALFVFLRPMSAADYEDAVDEHVVEIYDATAEVNESLVEYSEYGTSDWDPDEQLDGADWDDTQADVRESLDVVEENAKKLRRLRAPSEYSAEDRRLTEWADYMLDEYIPQTEELLGSVEDGDKYSQVASDISRYQEREYEAAEKATRGFWRAAEELGLSVYGE